MFTYFDWCLDPLPCISMLVWCLVDLYRNCFYMCRDCFDREDWL